MKLEELQLQSYLSLDYGYKKLGYTFKREADQKFQHFECFTVLVSSPLGKTTINYYDKKTGKLIMLIYPNMNRSVFIDFYKAKGITCASKILMVDNSGAITESTLTSLNYEESLDSNWFNVPVTAVHKVPETFKTGTFRYVDVNDGSIIVREKNRQFEISGETKVAYNLEWTSDSDYLIYRLKNVSNPPTKDNIEFVKVRIIAWTKNKYYCQYISSGNNGGTCVFEKLD